MHKRIINYDRLRLGVFSLNQLMTVKRLELKHKRPDIALMHRDYCDYLRDHQPRDKNQNKTLTKIEHELSISEF